MADRFPLLKFLVFMIVCLLFAVWLVAVIGNISFEDRADYTAEFEDAFGLLVNDAVKIAGVTVGKVSDMQVENGLAVISFSVRTNVNLGEDSTVDIRWRSILGQRFVYVNPRGDGSLAAGHRFDLAHTETPADLGKLLEELTPVMRALSPEDGNRVVQALNDALSGNVAEARALLAEGASLVQALASRENEISSLLKNSATLVDAYASREGELRALLDSFASVADTLGPRTDTLEGFLTDVPKVEAELRRLLEVNDANIRGVLAAADKFTSILAVNQDRLDRVAEFTYQGIVGYHLVSRWGQWFNVNSVGWSLGGVTGDATGGAAFPSYTGPTAASAGVSSLFGAEWLSAAGGAG